MELNNIEKLLEKYFEGKTTLNEEVTIRQYFTTNKVPVHLEPYQDLFGYYVVKQQEALAKPIVLSKRLRLPYKWLSIAAMLVFILGVYIFKSQDDKLSQTQLLQDYQTTQQALDLISKNLNKGVFAMVQLKEFETTKDKIFKETNK